MDRITGDYVTDLGGGRRGFRDRNLSLAQVGTVHNALYHNGVQEEMCGLIEAFGVALASGDWTGVRRAVNRAAGGNLRTLTASATLTADDAGMVLVNAGANTTVTLPPANAAAGRPLRFNLVRLDQGSAVVNVAVAAGELIEDAATIPLPVSGRLTLCSDGVAGWRAVDGPGGLLGFQVVSASANITVPPGALHMLAIAVGGGGGGANCQASGPATSRSGGGGGAGGTAIGVYPVKPGQIIPVTVPAQASAQTPGGTTSIGAFCAATGGGQSGFISTLFSPGGQGGTASGGNVANVGGGDGGDGQSAAFIFAGNGGSGPMGGGGRAGGGGGMSGRGYGGGGGGAHDTGDSGIVYFGGQGGPAVAILGWMS